MLSRRITGPITIHRLRNEMDRILEGVLPEGWTDPFGWHVRSAFPAMNFWEDAEALHAEAEVPGLRIEDLDITVTGNELTVEGEQESCEEPGTTCHRRERRVGKFSRKVRLPVDIDANQVQAKLQEGVLTITLPKSEAIKPRKVEVKALEK